MQRLLIPFVAAIVMALSGCNNAKSPDAVASDVAKAEQRADAKVDDKLKDLNNKDAKGIYEVAMTAAEGDHKVALEQCDALSGAAQKDCKDKADADYDLAKARAKADLSAAKQ
jgi:hypothetical protein